ncbi:competence protein ComK [Bacillus badius]|uniref:competence protein ComK n=1 Tax=Bacillus badius TaxID=1455 RepID=UPI0006980ABE|nr:competence protein ComK [Bacillus badius]MED4715968.1 competence protein ComK [Bacillus badius]
MKFVENYRITTDTMALMEEYHQDYNTIIYDKNGIYCTKQTVRLLLNEACIERISTYEGRIKAIRQRFPYRKKTPLIICLQERLCAFPTTSPDNYGCIWILPHQIHTCFVRNGQLIVAFKNGMELPLSCSLYIFNRQRERTANCLSYFEHSLSN